MRRWPAGAAVGGAVTLAVAMSVGRFAYTPVLPFMRDADGLSTSAAGWIASANYLGYLVGAATAGPLARRFGLRPAVRAGLVVSVITTAAMAATSTPLVWAALRLVGGIASAWAMIAVTSLVLAGTADRRPTSDVMFAGVGGGIVVSTLVIAACAQGSDRPGPMWLALGATGAVGALVGDHLLGRGDGTLPPHPARRSRPPLSPEVRRLVVAYACAGFGYVITATYLVLIVRESDLGQSLEFLTWCVVGAFATCSPWLWNRVADRNGDRPALVAAHGVLAAGVLTTAFAPGTFGVLAGGALFGATFVGIVGVGVDLARRLHALDPTRAIAVMTVAFAVGQMVGPAVGGWLADATGTFRVPSVVAAVVLVAGAVFLLPQWGDGIAPPDGPAVADDGVVRPPTGRGADT
jgi:MFS family permease